jgi:peptidoglycan/xylan/chitin deacetylase (PgdA/CDA1 family)
VSIDDFFSGNLSPKKINVVITFDDGYKSWVTDSVPILKELELPATFFVSSGFVGLSKESEADFLQSKLLIPDSSKATGGLTFKDLRNIAEEGFTIGGHTLNHINLAKLMDKNQLRHEIAEDKIRLENIIGKKIKFFAYPFGALQNPEINLTDVLREFGYIGAVTTISGFNRISANPYLLHREITDAAMPESVFKARVYGNYDAVRFLKQQVNKILQWR